MRVVENVVLDEDIFEEQFVCNLAACKGACCVEGEGGAPLSAEEAVILAHIRPALRPFLSDAGNEALDAQGTAVFADGEYETPLIGHHGPCAYVVMAPDGTAQCGIEHAYQAGAVAFQKPISCHLYPIRVEQQGPFEHLYYHRWPICAAACTHGAALQVPVFRFLQVPLIRKYGERFYAALEAIASGKSGISTENDSVA